MKPLKEKYLVIVAGPTAVGKTSAAITLAEHFSSEIINADARQFYKEMKIGTAKPPEDELKKIPHHFIGHLSILDSYDAGRFVSDTLQLLEELFIKHDIIFLTGGSGLFIKGVTDGFDELPPADPEIRKQLTEQFEKEGIESLQKILEEKDPDYYAVVDRKNPHRLIRALEVCIVTGRPYSSLRKNEHVERPFHSIKICLSTDKEKLYQAINVRTEKMFADGLVDEVKTLLPYRNRNALQTVGYRELFSYFDGKISLQEAKELIQQNTRYYAKRQLTWFRKDQDYAWFEPQDISGMIRFIEKQLQ